MIISYSSKCDAEAVCGDAIEDGTGRSCYLPVLFRNDAAGFYTIMDACGFVYYGIMDDSGHIVYKDKRGNIAEVSE